MRFRLYREAVAGAVVEAAQGMDAWSTKLQELEQSFLTEGVDTQAVDLMLGFDAVSASLPVSTSLRPQIRSRKHKRHAWAYNPASIQLNTGQLHWIFAMLRCTGATQMRFRKISVRTRVCPMR